MITPAADDNRQEIAGIWLPSRVIPSPHPFTYFPPRNYLNPAASAPGAAALALEEMGATVAARSVVYLMKRAVTAVVAVERVATTCGVPEP